MNLSTTVQHHARTCLVTAAAMLAAAAGYNLAGGAVEAQAPAPAPKIWTGVYSAAQMERGKAVYDAYCVRCHNADLTGGAGGGRGGRGRGRAGGPPALKDDRFWLDFDGQPLSSLLSKIQRTMPQDAPGSLRDDDYVDLLAFILAQNAFPAGRADLPSGGLDAVLIVGRSGASREAANFGLARAVGCLTPGAKNTWVLTNVAAPSATRDERATPASATEAGTLPLGSERYRLIDVGHLNPAAHAGERMEIRGLLNRAPDDPRIDVLSMAPVGMACAQGDGPNTYPNPYHLVENWMQLPGVEAGVWPEHQVVGIGFDKDANIILFQRADPPFLKFDPSGRKILKTWGEGMYVEPHGFQLMPDGSVWATDASVKNGIGGQVIHFSADGQVLLALGTKGVLGEGADKFLGATGVAIAKNGDVFVSDGHRGGGNHGVVRFSKDGQFIKSWGAAGSGPGQFNAAHSIAIDSQGRIFVCDRGNNRIQIFDQDGRLLDEWKQFGRPETILITPDDTMYVPDTQSNSRNNPGFKRGIRIGSAKDGSVNYFIPDPEPEPDKVQTSAAVAVAVDSKGNLYTSEVWSDTNVGMAKMLKKYVKN